MGTGVIAARFIPMQDAFFDIAFAVIPAQAGVSTDEGWSSMHVYRQIVEGSTESIPAWIPACAGMTSKNEYAVPISASPIPAPQ